MWIIMNDSFISVVKKGPKNKLVVRARRFEDLEKFVKSNRIFIDDTSDYRFRVYMTAKELSSLISQEIEGINYSNFKDSVKEKERKSFYEEVWQVLLMLDRKRKWRWFGVREYNYGTEGFDEIEDEWAAR